MERQPRHAGVTTASADGLVVTTGESWTATEFDEGAVFGFDGANAGQIRKITSTSATAGTVRVAFDNDTVVGDNFIRVPYWPLDSNRIQLTTLLTEADASIALPLGQFIQRCGNCLACHRYFAVNAGVCLDVQGRRFLVMTWPEDPSIPVDWVFDEIYEPGRPGPNKSDRVDWFERFRSCGGLRSARMRISAASISLAWR